MRGGWWAAAPYPLTSRKIRRSYAQRYGEDKVVDLEDREKVDVTDYFGR